MMSVRELFSDTHEEIIVDNDPCFLIDHKARTIKNQSTVPTVLVKNDHNSQRFTFQIERYIEGHDMLNCNIVKVHFDNTDSDTKEVISDSYQIKDWKICANDDTFIEGTWLLSNNATSKVGPLDFSIEFECISDGEVSYRLNTTIYTGTKILKTINNTVSIVIENSDILGQMQADIDDLDETVSEMKPQIIELLSIADFENTIQGPFVKQYQEAKINLKKSAMYYFEVADTSRVYIYKSNGSQASSVGAVAALLFIPHSNDGYAKLLALEKMPSASSLSEVLSLINSMDEIFASVRISNVNLDGAYLQATNNESIWCWEISAQHDTAYRVGSYTIKSLVSGITAELKVKLSYDVSYDEYAVFIGDSEIYRANAGESVRVASEILASENTQIVFFENGEEVIRAKTKPTIKNCGILYTEGEE